MPDEFGAICAVLSRTHAACMTGQNVLADGGASHHVKGIEVYRERLLLYGCGDLLNDYEGIGVYDSYRPGLGLMYFASLDARARRLVNLAMVPIRVQRFQIQRASDDETSWLLATLNREGQRFGTGVEQRNADLLLRGT